MRVDAIDRQILITLQREGRIANKALAERVSLSPSACLVRVRRLEAQGLLRGYTAQIALEKLTPFIEVFAEVTLANHAPRDFARFERAVDEIAEITDCFKVSGSCDYLLKLVCIDVRDYTRVSDAMLESDLGIKSLQTLISLAQTKERRGYPLDRLLADPRQREGWNYSDTPGGSVAGSRGASASRDATG